LCFQFNEKKEEKTADLAAWSTARTVTLITQSKTAFRGCSHELTSVKKKDILTNEFTNFGKIWSWEDA